MEVEEDESTARTVRPHSTKTLTTTTKLHSRLNCSFPDRPILKTKLKRKKKHRSDDQTKAIKKQ